jgi:hypothetical protein
MVVMKDGTEVGEDAQQVVGLPILEHLAAIDTGLDGHDGLKVLVHVPPKSIMNQLPTCSRQESHAYFRLYARVSGLA